MCVCFFLWEFVYLNIRQKEIRRGVNKKRQKKKRNEKKIMSTEEIVLSDEEEEEKQQQKQSPPQQQQKQPPQQQKPSSDFTIANKDKTTKSDPTTTEAILSTVTQDIENWDWNHASYEYMMMLVRMFNPHLKIKYLGYSSAFPVLLIEDEWKSNIQNMENSKREKFIKEYNKPPEVKPPKAPSTVYSWKIPEEQIREWVSYEEWNKDKKAVLQKYPEINPTDGHFFYHGDVIIKRNDHWMRIKSDDKGPIFTTPPRNVPIEWDSGQLEKDLLLLKNCRAGKEMRLEVSAGATTVTENSRHEGICSYNPTAKNYIYKHLYGWYEIVVDKDGTYFKKSGTNDKVEYTKNIGHHINIFSDGGLNDEPLEIDIWDLFIQK